MTNRNILNINFYNKYKDPIVSRHSKLLSKMFYTGFGFIDNQSFSLEQSYCYLVYDCKLEQKPKKSLLNYCKSRKLKERRVDNIKALMAFAIFARLNSTNGRPYSELQRAMLTYDGTTTDEKQVKNIKLLGSKLDKKIETKDYLSILISSIYNHFFNLVFKIKLEKGIEGLYYDNMNNEQRYEVLLELYKRTPELIMSLKENKNKGILSGTKLSNFSEILEDFILKEKFIDFIDKKLKKEFDIKEEKEETSSLEESENYEEHEAQDEVSESSEENEAQDETSETSEEYETQDEVSEDSTEHQNTSEELTKDLTSEDVKTF